MRKLKVTVDHNRCVGSKLCVMFSPGVFELNDEGQSQVVTTEGRDEKNILDTAEQCPQSAIRVEDAETGELLFPPEEFA